MKSFDTDIKKYTEKTHLKNKERRELRERILSYMEYHPLPKESRKTTVEKIKSESFILVHLNTIYTRVLGGAFALLLIIAIPVAAERSVPGDVLYLVKTHVNEGIRTQLANSPYEKIELETDLMERRIAEARLLAREGKLTEEVEAAIALTVKGHADAARAGIANLRVNNADEAAIAEIVFDSALQIQSAVLDTNISRSATSSTDSIALTVREAQVHDVNKSTSTPSYEGLMARVEAETTRAYELFSTIDSSATETERSDIIRRLEDVDRKIVTAQSSIEESREEAVAKLSSALNLIQKIIVFMTDIDVREHVLLETLVPVEYTSEEKTEVIQTRIAEVLEIKTIINAKITFISDTDVSEKAQVGIESLESALERATTSLAAEEFDTAAESADEAYAFSIDLMNLLSGIIIPIDDIIIEDPIENATSTPTSTEEVIESEG